MSFTAPDPTYCRLTVLAPRARVDVALPADLPVAELVPMVLELVGEPAPGGPAASRGGCPGRPDGAAARCRPAPSSGCWTASCCGSPRTGAAPPPPVFDDPVRCAGRRRPSTPGRTTGCARPRCCCWPPRRPRAAGRRAVTGHRGPAPPACARPTEPARPRAVGAGSRPGCGRADGLGGLARPRAGPRDRTVPNLRAATTAALAGVPLATVAGWAALPGAPVAVAAAAGRGWRPAAAAASPRPRSAHAGARAGRSDGRGGAGRGGGAGRARLAVPRRQRRSAPARSRWSPARCCRGPRCGCPGCRARWCRPTPASCSTPTTARTCCRPPSWPRAPTWPADYLAGLVGGCALVGRDRRGAGRDGSRLDRPGVGRGHGGPARVAGAQLRRPAPGPRAGRRARCWPASGWRSLLAWSGPPWARPAAAVVLLAAATAVLRRGPSAGVGSPVRRRAVDLGEGLLTAAVIPLAFGATDLYGLVRGL